jgi:hypothetical protein
MQHNLRIYYAQLLARLPPPLWNVPTDTDYAMELMAERVAKGLDVRPSSKVRRKRRIAKGHKAGSPSASSLSLATPGNRSQVRLGEDNDSDEDDQEPPQGRRRKRDWVKTAVKAAAASRAWVDEGKQLVRSFRSESWPDQNPDLLMPPTALAHANPAARAEKHRMSHPIVSCGTQVCSFSYSLNSIFGSTCQGTWAYYPHCWDIILHTFSSFKR